MYLEGCTVLTCIAGRFGLHGTIASHDEQTSMTLTQNLIELLSYRVMHALASALTTGRPRSVIARITLCKRTLMSTKVSED